MQHPLYFRCAEQELPGDLASGHEANSQAAGPASVAWLDAAILLGSMGFFAGVLALILK